MNQTSSFRGSFEDLSDWIRVNPVAVPAGARPSRTNQNPPTAEPPGNVQGHQQESPTCVCHMELQVTAELKPQQDICCFASIRNFPFQRSREAEDRKVKSSKGVRRGGSDPVRLQGRLGSTVVSELENTANAAPKLPPKLRQKPSEKQRPERCHRERRHSHLKKK